MGQESTAVEDSESPPNFLITIFCNEQFYLLEGLPHTSFNQLFHHYTSAPIWNRLPAEAVNSNSVEQFKIELDKVIDTLI